MKRQTLRTDRPIVFDYRDYKAYILDWILSQPGGGRGQKSRIAENLKCQLAYVSQVLTTHAHFSPEQADLLNRYFEHDEESADFFLLLVHRGRAGTRSLEAYYDRKIQKALDQRFLLKNRLKDKRTIRREDQAVYYSSWSFAAIHIAVLVPELRTAGALARYFGLGLDATRKTLDFLTSIGLVREEKGEFLSGEMRIHLENDSPMISKHHTNWRMKAIQSLERESPHALHYSSVATIAHEDALKVREVLVKAIEKARETIRDSKDEGIYCYALDLFSLDNKIP